MDPIKEIVASIQSLSKRVRNLETQKSGGASAAATQNHHGLLNLEYSASGHVGFEPVKGSDDNYVTDAEKVVIGNTSGVNTGDSSGFGLFLLLDGSNDPITGDIDIIADSSKALRILNGVGLLVFSIDTINNNLIFQAKDGQLNSSPFILFQDFEFNPLMHLHTDSYRNLFLGYNAGIINDISTGDGIFNTFIGSRAGELNTTGSRNTVVGSTNLYANVDGGWNTVLGQANLYENTSGNGNTAIGGGNLCNNTVGGQNIAIGQSNLYSNEDGDYNISIGYMCMDSNLTGSVNIAIGYQVMSSFTDGYGNIGIGDGAMSSSTGGDSNIALGVSSLRDNVSGSDNVAIGTNSLESNVDGGYNVALGYYSLNSNETGDDNVAIGEGSLENNVSGNVNIAIGLYSLDNLTTGSRNISIGGNSGYNQLNISDTLIIDNRQRLSISAEISNSILYGNMADSASDQRLRINALIHSNPDTVPLTVIGRAPVSMDIYTIEIVSNELFIVTTVDHGFLEGDSVTIAGATAHSDVNGTYTITGIISGGQFKVSLVHADVTPAIEETGTSSSPADQTANLQEWQDGNGTVVASVDKFGTVQSSGRRRNVTTKTDDYLAHLYDEVIVCDKATAIEITLPASTGEGQVFTVKNIGAGVATITPDGADTIDSQASKDLNTWEFVSLCDSTAGTWVII